MVGIYANLAKVIEGRNLELGVEVLATDPQQSETKELIVLLLDDSC